MNLIVDLDGTLFDNSHRAHLVPEDKSNANNWIKFNAACKDDTPILRIINQVKHLYSCDMRTNLIFLTSRGTSALSPTRKQLKQHFPKPYKYTLVMRDMDDHSKPVDYKRNQLNTLYIGYGPVIVFEDNPVIVDMIEKEYPHFIIVKIPSTCITV